MFSLNTMPNLQDSSVPPSFIPTDRESSSSLYFFAPSMGTHLLCTTKTRSSFGARETEVSTELKMYDESWNIKKRKIVSRDIVPYHFSDNDNSLSFTPTEPAVSNVFLAAAMEKIAGFQSYIPEEEEEGRQMGISTNLKLYEDPWIIKKRLMESDIGSLCRLLLKKEIFQTHIVPMLGPVREREIESNEGTKVIIWDYDTETEHQLKLKKWPATKSYVLINGWRAEFVNRRELKQGDEIGLFWDQYSSRFGFRVLQRVPRY